MNCTGCVPPIVGDTVHRVSGQKIKVERVVTEIVDGKADFRINGEFMWHVLVATGATIERSK